VGSDEAVLSHPQGGGFHRKQVHSAHVTTAFWPSAAWVITGGYLNEAVDVRMGFARCVSLGLSQRGCRRQEDGYSPVDPSRLDWGFIGRG
jgi:hypothetical protein